MIVRTQLLMRKCIQPTGVAPAQLGDGIAPFAKTSPTRTSKQT